MWLEIADLHTGYGEIEVIHGISLGVEVGEIVTLLGSNGAGKSTLLSAIVGLLPPEQGNILFRGNSIRGLPPHRIVEQGIVLVPEGRHIFPSMTVLENLELGSFSARARPRRQQTLRKVFSLFSRLEERQQQVAGTLSGGEQQMLAIGRGLMAMPDLLMLDEPSLGLSPMVVKEIFEVIKGINNDGTTVLLVEQSAMQSLQIATRGYVLENGALTIAGPVSDLLNNPSVKIAYLGV